MKLGVTHKLFLAILTAAGLAVISSVLIMQWSLGRGFLKFVNSVEKSGISRLAANLEENYRHEQSWDFLRRDPGQWRRLISESLPDAAPQPGEGSPDLQPPGRMGEGRMPPGPHRLVRHFDQRLFLLDAERKVLVGHTEAPVDNSATPLRYRGAVVGYLGLLPRTHVSEAPQLRFLKEQKLAFVLAAGMVVLLAGGLSLLLARRLVRPLSEITRATHQLAAGTFDVRVPVTSQDELGQLAGDFNSLALALGKGEQTRRRWVADISHELRTPLAILRGEIEALQDGIRQPTPDMIHSLHSEVLRLSRLVDDLFQLSLSDAGALSYRKAVLKPADVLDETIDAYRQEFLSKTITVDPDLSDARSATVFGDGARLRQLFSNLLDNALKYTDSGGRLKITLKQGAGNVELDFQDSAPGVPSSELERLFERLYRVESSRSRETGGAGLGLSICRNIVEAHGGTITARPSPLGGVWIQVILPLDGGRS